MTVFSDVLPGIDQWSLSLGRLLLNCGALELLSYRWIKLLSTDPVLYTFSLRIPFGKRLDIIDQLISRSNLPTDRSRRAITVWKRIRDISELRNKLAHNPLIFGWYGPQEGPPDYIGVPDVRKALSGQDIRETIVDLQIMEDTVVEIRQIGPELESLYNEIAERKGENQDV